MTSATLPRTNHRAIDLARWLSSRGIGIDAAFALLDVADADYATDQERWSEVVSQAHGFARHQLDQAVADLLTDLHDGELGPISTPTDAQLDGEACALCGEGFAAQSASVPHGTGPRGQLFRCANDTDKLIARTYSNMSPEMRAGADRLIRESTRSA